MIARFVEQVIALLGEVTVGELAALRAPLAARTSTTRARRRHPSKRTTRPSPAAAALEVGSTAHEITDPSALLEQLEAIARGGHWATADKQGPPIL